jgi:hypothetical protein
MNKWLLISIYILLFSCKEKTTDTYLTPEKASQYFRDVEEICKKDNGKLWGKNLYGPLMFVDRVSRKIVANQPDKEGLLKLKDGVYTGLYPKELIINNSVVSFGETTFATAPLPPNEEDGYRIKTRAIHGLLHSFQNESGIPPSFFNITSMDEKGARLWVKLEWKALRKAILSSGGDKQLAIRDALIFRNTSREFYSKYAKDETMFENYEGLATFTHILLLSNSNEDFLKRIIENLDRVYSFQSYARSYGSIHGALYATLLFDKGFDFRTVMSDTIDLCNKVKLLYNIKLPAICRDVAGSLALNYDIDGIYKEEEKRMVEIRENIHKQVSTFTEKPVVFLELESPYFDFEPEDIHSLDTLGTLYNSMRISDNWGKLTVDKGGCLVSNNLKYLRITSKGFKEAKNRISGEGWHLILNNDWELVEVNENYFVRKLMP